MKIEILKSQSRIWDEYVSSSRTASMYHLSGWIDVIKNSFQFEPYYVQLMENEEIAAILPLFLVKKPFGKRGFLSMPFVSYGGVCAECEEKGQRIIDETVEVGKREAIDYAEFRNLALFGTDLQLNLEKANYLLDIRNSKDDLLKKFRKQTRNRIRKSKKKGLVVKRGHDLLPDFYELFAIAMKEHGTPVMPFSFFSEVISTFADLVTVLVAYKEKTAVGAKLSFIYKDTYYLAWGGYPNRYRKELANYLLTWEVIKIAKDLGLTSIDFGRSTKNSGPANFKKYFNAEEKQLYFQYWSDSGKPATPSTARDKYSLMINIWKKLPLRMTKMIGPQLVKYFP